jgi:hypothetical protein
MNNPLEAALRECADKLWIAYCDSKDDKFRAAATHAVDMATDALSMLRPTPAAGDGDMREASDALYQEARRLAGADVNDQCVLAHQQIALNWVRNRREQLARAALQSSTPKTEGEG